MAWIGNRYERVTQRQRKHRLRSLLRMQLIVTKSKELKDKDLSLTIGWQRKMSNRMQHRDKAPPQNGRGLQDHRSQKKRRKEILTSREDLQEKAQRAVVEVVMWAQRSSLTHRKRKQRLDDQKSNSNSEVP